MARLNDPAQNGPTARQPLETYPAEAVEAWRRKMMRQNRELARVNSTQAIRLRQLESECARMLSENLELRSHILRLEKEAEENKTSRIADHALEIRAKLEAQLADMNELLSTLGNEPPAKRIFLSPRRIATPKSVSRRRPNGLRNMAKELEEQALEQGRLAPIMENNTYPRGPEVQEPLASSPPVNAADMVTSPALRSPLNSIFVDDESIPETPTRPPTKFTAPEPLSPAPIDEPAVISPAASRSTSPAPAPVETAKPVTEKVPIPAPKTGKRKLGHDVSEIIRVFDSERENIVPRKTKSKKNRSFAVGKENQVFNSETVEAPRKPLAAKSTNKDLSTARQQENGKKGEKLKANKFTENEKTTTLDNPQIHSRENHQEMIHIIQPTMAANNKLATGTVIPDEPSVTESEMALRSPTPKTTEESRGGDTPPPAHISSNGETSRPSRRARAAVSYAEPNLRDKMRRPTKALFDAVAGEGKYMRRSSASIHDVPADLLSKSSSRKSSEVMPVDAPQEPAMEAQAETTSSIETSSITEDDVLPSSVVTDRRKRRSSVWDVAPLAALKTTSIGPINTDDMTDDVDVYEFTVSSPVIEKKNKRRASATTANPDYPDGSGKPSRNRKRATMSASKRSRADMEASILDDSENSLTDSSSSAPRTKASMRRKSTMT